MLGPEVGQVNESADWLAAFAFVSREQRRRNGSIASLEPISTLKPFLNVTSIRIATTSRTVKTPLLFLKRACVSGDTHPFAVRVNPSVREPPMVIERFVLAEPFCVIDSDYHSSVSIHKHLLVRVCHKTGSIGKIAVVGQELGFRRERAIVVRADESVSQ